MMYVMCYFQVLPHSNIVIEELEPSLPVTEAPPLVTGSPQAAHKAADQTVPSEVSVLSEQGYLT